MAVDVEIRGQQSVDKAAREASGAIKGLKGDADSMNASFASAAVTAAAVVAVIIKIAEAVDNTVKIFAEQERSVMTWNAAMQQTGRINAEGAASLKDFAEAMAKVTGEDDEAILSLESYLATAGRTESEIRKIITAAADLSTVDGDLSGNVEKLNKTYAGQAGRLAQLVPEIDGMTEAQYKAGAAVDIIAAKYKGLSDGLQTLADVSIKNNKNAWDDLFASIGQAANVVIQPHRDAITEVVGRWTAAIVEANKYRKAMKDIGEEAGAALVRDQITIASHQLGQLRNQEQAYLASMGLDSYQKYSATMAISNQYTKEKVDPSFSDFNARIVKALNDASNGTSFKAQESTLEASIKALEAQLKKLTEEAANPPAAGIVGSGGAGNAPKYNDSLVPPGGSMGDVNRTWADYAAYLGMQQPGYRQATWADVPTRTGTEPYSQGYSNASRIGATEWKESNPIMDIIESIGGKFMGMVGSLSSFQAILDPVTTIIQGAFNILKPAIDGILTPIVNILSSFGEIIGSSLMPIFDFLAATILPIVILNMKLIAVALEVVMSPLRWFGDLLKWVGEVLATFANNLTNPIWEKDDSYSSFSSDAFSGLADRIAAIWNNDYSKQSLYGTSTASSGMTGGNASYSKPRDITVNIQLNTAAMVGTDGFREFSLTVGRELRSAGVLGMA